MPRFRTHALAVLCTVTGCCLVLAGCAAPGASPAPGAAARTVPVVDTAHGTAGLRLPLDAYQPSLAEYGRLAVAARVLLRRCMAGLGYDYSVAEPAHTGPRTWTERRYGLTDPAQADHGYWPAGRVAPPRPHRQSPADPALAAAQAAALTGTAAGAPDPRVPAGGCTAAADRRLTAKDPVGADRYLAQRLGSDSFRASREDPAVRRATAAWSACMAAAGYRYANPLDPPRDHRFQGPAASSLEIATARADVACEQRTGLAVAWYAAEARIQGPLVAANRPALALAKTAFDAELAVAAGVGA